MSYEDPGWRGVSARVLGGLLKPWKGHRLADGLDGVSTLRMLSILFVGALFLYLFVTFQLVEEDHDPVRSLTVWGIALVGIASILGARWAAGRPLNASSDQELAASYRTNFFVGIVFAESPALIGFALSFVEGSRIPYLWGFAFSLVAMLTVAPTRGHLERRQRDITTAGSPLSLGEALSRSYPRSDS